MSSLRINLVCWQCGKKKAVAVPFEPHLGAELMQIAENVGWLGRFDMYRHRVLVLCSAKCNKLAVTKDGFYRLHPKRA